AAHRRPRFAAVGGGATRVAGVVASGQAALSAYGQDERVQQAAARRPPEGGVSTRPLADLPPVQALATLPDLDGDRTGRKIGCVEQALGIGAAGTGHADRDRVPILRALDGDAATAAAD